MRLAADAGWAPFERITKPAARVQAGEIATGKGSLPRSKVIETLFAH